MKLIDTQDVLYEIKYSKGHIKYKLDRLACALGALEAAEHFFDSAKRYSRIEEQRQAIELLALASQWLSKASERNEKVASINLLKKVQRMHEEAASRENI